MKGDMPKFVSDEVPFAEVDGRRALTAAMCDTHPELAVLVRTFPDSFEYSMAWDAWFFIEPKERVLN